MTKEEIRGKLEAVERQLKEMESLKTEIENLKSKLNEVQENEIPELPYFEATQDFWFVDSELEVNDGKNVRSREMDDYNHFHSEKYAKLFENKVREIAMLLHCKWYVDRDYCADFNNMSQAKWTVYYNYVKECYEPDFWFSEDRSTVYFENKEAAQKAADWMNAHITRPD